MEAMLFLMLGGEYLYKKLTIKSICNSLCREILSITQLYFKKSALWEEIGTVYDLQATIKFVRLTVHDMCQKGSIFYTVTLKLFRQKRFLPRTKPS